MTDLQLLIKKGTTGQDVVLTVQNMPADPTAGTIKFSMSNRETGAVKVNQATGAVSSIVNNGDGTYDCVLTYDMTASDVDNIGEYEGLFKVTTAGGAVFHVPEDKRLFITIETPV